MSTLKHRAYSLICSLPGGRIALAYREYRRRGRQAGLKFSWRYTTSGGAITISRRDRVLIVSARHMTYISDILREFDTYFEAVKPEERNGRKIVDFSRPGWHELSRSGEKVYLAAFVEGDSVNDVYLEYAHLMEVGVVIDLGANCGLAALAFSKAVGPTGRVIALEPDPVNFSALKRNIEQHGRRNIQAVNEGVWSHSGKIEFQSDGSMGALILDKSQPQTPRGTRMQIQVATLQDIAERFALSQIDFIKMDIETAERTVVPALGDFVLRYPARWMIEAHEPGTDALIREFFESNDYRVTAITQHEDHAFPLLLCEPALSPVNTLG